MTRTEIRNLALEFCKVDGQQYLAATQTTELNALINRCLIQVGSKYPALYDDQIQFTLVPGTHTYNLRNAASFARRISKPLQVVIDGLPLQSPRGGRGKSSMAELNATWEVYRTSPNSKPLFWAEKPPQHLRLFPTPDFAYADSYVSGWYLPPDLTTDAQEPELPLEYHEAFTRYVAAKLLEPYSSGESVAKRMRLQAEAEADLARMRDDAQRAYGGSTVRGYDARMIYRL
jgi:hypothetical protein